MAESRQWRRLIVGALALVAVAVGAVAITIALLGRPLDDHEAGLLVLAMTTALLAGLAFPWVYRRALDRSSPSRRRGSPEEALRQWGRA